MAAHRYWRLVGFCVPGTGALELSEARMYAAGTLADASATVTCSIAPTSGTLAVLKDGLSSAAVSWPFAAHSSPGFALAWDLTGAGADVDTIRLGSGSGAATFPVDLMLQWSDDLVQWATSMSAIAITYPGAWAMTVEPSDSGDTHYTKVALTLHCNGANGSTTFADTSSRPKTVTAGGGAKVSTAQSKFGGASALFNGSADYLTVPSHTDFDLGTGDFTIEAFIMPTSVTGGRMIACRQESGSGMAFQLRTNGTALEAVLRGVGGVGLVVLAGGTVSTAAMQHISVSRSGSAVYLALAGAIVATGTFALSLTPAVSRPFTVAVLDDGSALLSNYAGYIDEVRVTKGAARYVAAFTPPAASFPDAVVPALATDVPAPHRLRQVPLAPPRILGSTQPGGAARGTLKSLPFFDAYNGGLGIVFGTVKEKNTPANTPLRRRVVLIDERSRMAIRETWSDAITGNYEFRGVKEGVPYTVLSYDHLHNYRATIADNLPAEVLP